MKNPAIVWQISLAAASLCAAAMQPAVGADTARWSPTLDAACELTRTPDGRPIERYTHPAARPEWGYGPDQGGNQMYVVSPKKPAANAPLCVVLHSANRCALDYLGYVFLNRKVDPWDNPSDTIVSVPDGFYGLFLNSSNDEWWGWSAVRDGGDKYASSTCPAERRVLDSVEWAIDHYGIDRNRVYLCGVSMGGCGTLGIGMAHGDVFASACVWVPAGMQYVSNRMGGFTAGAKGESVWSRNGLPDPPPVVDIFGQDDIWSETQNTLLDAAKWNRFALVAGWAPFGHSVFKSTVGNDSLCSAASVVPWMEIRRNEAYPVFTNTTTDQRPPRYDNPSDKQFDSSGQINAYIRWRNDLDEPGVFAMKLWTVSPTPGSDGAATTDVTLRRLQRLHPSAGRTFEWTTTRTGKAIARGRVTADNLGLLTIPQMDLTPIPTTLRITPIEDPASRE